MKAKFVLPVMVLILSLFPAFSQASSQAVKVKERYKKDEIIVKYKATAKADISRQLKKSFNISSIKSYKKAKLHHLRLPKNMTVESAVAALSKDPNVEYAEPNYYYHINAVPNDPFFSSQWGLHNTGQTVNGTSGTADADIDAPEAWDIISDASDVVVAVIDSGVDYNHPDLAENIWVNKDEIPANGIDDDGNSLIDDAIGWDFASHDKDPMDQNGHGTHVAGIIGAAGNNGIGIAGVAWKTKLMVLRGLGPDGYGLASDLIDAIEYATDKGAAIINISWGGDEFSQAMKDSINASLALFVCSAGNDKQDTDITPNYPSSFDSPNIISVAASNRELSLADFSNYGMVSVDIIAPGVDIYSTSPSTNGQPYVYKSGTSMSTAYISGTAAIVKSIRTEFDNSEIKSAIENNGFKLAFPVSSKSFLNTYDVIRKVNPGVFGKESEFQVSPDRTYSNDSNNRPAVTFGQDSSLVAWTSKLSQSGMNAAYGIFGRIIDKSGALSGSVFQISVSLSSQEIFPSVASLKNGNFIVTWKDEDGLVISGIVLDKNGNRIGDQFNANTSYYFKTKNPYAISLEDGGFIIIWSSSSGIFGQRFDSSKNKIGQEFMMSSSSNQKTLKLLSLPGNRFFLCWANTYTTYGQFFDEGFNAIGSQFQIDPSGFPNSNAFIITPDLAILPEGRFVCTWNARYEGIYAQIFNPDGTKHGNKISVFISGISSNPSVESLSNGYFLITWSMQKNIFAQLFNRDGEKIGNEIIVNTLSSYNVGFSDVTKLNAETFIVAWHSDQLSNSNDIFHGTDVFATRLKLKDADQDGILDEIEKLSCTGYNNPDSDNDGIPDGKEDKNFNGVVDPGETNPCLLDSDGDTLSDGIEDTNHDGIVDAGETNPAKADTDDDSLPDGYEKLHGLNPLAHDAGLDKDGDGYSNYREYLAGTSPADPGVVPGLLADPDSDLDADAADLWTIMNELGRQDCTPQAPCLGDLDGSGRVDEMDLRLLSEDYGRTTTAE